MELALSALFLIKIYVYNSLPTCMSVHYMHAGVPGRPEENMGAPITRVIDGCEPSRACWELSLSLLQEQ